MMVGRLGRLSQLTGEMSALDGGFTALHKAESASGSSYAAGCLGTSCGQILLIVRNKILAAVTQALVASQLNYCYVLYMGMQETGPKDTCQTINRCQT